MKTTRLILALMIGLALQGSDQFLEPNHRGLRLDGPMTFPKPVVVVTPALEEDHATVLFPFINNTTTTYYYSGSENNCGCIDMTVTPTVIPPGMQGTVAATKSWTANDGDHRQRIVITWRAGQPDGPDVVQDIAIQARILPTFQSDSKDGMLWMYGASPLDTKKITLTRTKKGFGTITSIVPPRDGKFEVALSPGKDPGTWVLAVTPKDDPSIAEKGASDLTELEINLGDGRTRRQFVWHVVMPSRESIMHGKKQK